MINIVKNRKYPFIVSSVLFLISVIVLLCFGLKPGIDFTGGSLLEVKFAENRPETSEVREVLLDLGLGDIIVQNSDEDKIILRMKFLSEDEHQEILTAIRIEFGDGEEEQVVDNGIEDEEVIEPEIIEIDAESAVVEELNFEIPGTEGEVIEEPSDEPDQNIPAVLEERFETIGPAISAQLRQRSMYAAIAVVLAIILYIGYAFRKVSKPVQSWKYGITAIIALVHDVTIAMAIFALLGRFAGVEVGIPFVVALLTIMGYSVNDTIVVFDRVRENLIKRGSDHFAETVNMGVTQSITRSINTSITTLLVLFALFLFGGDSIHYFSLTLIIGVIVGTYSSIFLASPLLVVWERLKYR
jgi:preprotein translocase subunit SecF